METIQVLITTVKTNSNSFAHKQVNFLLETLNILENKAQLMAVENLLLNIPPMIGGNYPKLVIWLKINYGLTADNSQWHQLSAKAKNALKQWIGAVNYKDFEKLINIIAEHLSYLLERANSYDEKQRIKAETPNTCHLKPDTFLIHCTLLMMLIIDYSLFCAIFYRITVRW